MVWRSTHGTKTTCLVHLHHTYCITFTCMRIVCFHRILVRAFNKNLHFTPIVSTGSHIGDPDEMLRGEHEEELGRVEAYSIKIPPFWPSDPQVWFIQVEVQFAARGITAQQTKYHHIVASLSPEIATEIRDLLLKTPEDHPSDVLKEKLIERTVESKQRRLRQLLTAEELGDSGISPYFIRHVGLHFFCSMR